MAALATGLKDAHRYRYLPGSTLRQPRDRRVTDRRWRGRHAGAWPLPTVGLDEVADPGNVLEEHASELSERPAGRVVQGAKDRLAVDDLKGEDSGAATVRLLEPRAGSWTRRASSRTSWSGTVAHFPERPRARDDPYEPASRRDDPRLRRHTGTEIRSATGSPCGCRARRSRGPSWACGGRGLHGRLDGLPVLPGSLETRIARSPSRRRATGLLCAASRTRMRRP